MITNHGIHQWEVMPGLPDTGGQNVFVNRFTEELTRLGFRITIVNRGGYPHPYTHEWRKGLHYKDEHQRILYLEDGVNEFVRKEDMDERIPHLIEALEEFLDAEGTRVDWISSHYWDGLTIGVLYNRMLPERVKHVWTPHSLGAIKKRNVSPDQWAGLRVDERIAIERSMMEHLDGVAATSSTIRRSLRQDYEYAGAILFLPPCIDTDLHHPREVPDDDEVWDFLRQGSGLPVEELHKRRIVTEISRTAATKRKNVLIEAFSIAQQRVPNSLLVVSVDGNQKRLAGELDGLIRSLGLQNCVAAYVPDEILPALYAITDVYCTASVMEGFGMSAQEAAATAVPVVASHLVPFATEYLLGGGGFEGDGQSIKQGKGAVIVQADDVNGFARALEMLLTDDDLRKEMGENAYRITIPYFTWHNRVPAFLDEIGESLPLESERE
ncbi:MAG: glycosyltransferase [Chloroflexota bacterium]|nr:glycosyltransferase [Chloroflexota bacterium]